MEQVDPSWEELDYDHLLVLICHQMNYFPFVSLQNGDVSELDLTLVPVWLS